MSCGKPKIKSRADGAVIHYLWGVSNNRRVAPHDALCLPALAELDLSHVDVTIDNTHSFVQFKTKH